MAAVAAHHAGIDDAHATHYPAHDRDFKHETHGEAYRQESVDVGLYSYGVLHHIADLIRAEETEREGKNEEVTEQHARHEHDITAGNELHGIVPLPVIQCRGNETEQ